MDSSPYGIRCAKLNRRHPHQQTEEESIPLPYRMHLTALIGPIRLFIALWKMLFIRMIGPEMGRKNWIMRTEHAAQYASLLTPYQMHLTAFHQKG
jgi:hypothetical protein